MSIEKDVQSTKSQEKLLFAAGTLLARIQLLENIVKLCCGFMKVEDKNATFENLFSEDENKHKYTLGRLINLLKEPTCFTADFEERLDIFIKNRNIFIHKYWPVNEIYNIDENINEDKFNNMALFLDQMNMETIFMTNVFIGFHYAIGANIAYKEGKLEQLESDPEYKNMKIHLPLFLSVVEK
jgi:hypothetical protein